MQNMLHTTNAAMIGEHEVLIFNDGHMEVEDPQVNFQEERTLDHLCLDKDEAYKLYLLLHVKFTKC